MRGVKSASYLLLFVGAATLAAAEPEPIRIPQAPVEAPSPPAPGSPLDLTGEYVYAIDSDVEFILFAVPDGLVKFNKEAGPVRYRAKFVGGSGKVETRNFAGKYLAFVEAVGKGDVELLIVPVGAKVETAAIRQKLRVDSGTAPQPPPIIPPVPVTDPLTKSLQAAFDQELATVTDKQGKVWTKLDYASKLAALYAAAANVTVQDPRVKTYGDLFADMSSAAVFPPTVMPKLRQAVADYLDPKLKPSPAKLIDREATTTAFREISTALKGIK